MPKKALHLIRYVIVGYGFYLLMLGHAYAQESSLGGALGGEVRGESSSSDEPLRELSGDAASELTGEEGDDKTRAVKGRGETRQARRPSRTRDQEEKPLTEMSLSEMKEAGYVFAREHSPLLSSTSVRFALTLGTIVHGIGHFVEEDYGAGSFLLGMEVAGILLITGGALIPKLYDESVPLDILSTTMMATGITTVVSSWLFDLSGTFRANHRRLGEGSGFVDGLSIGLGYRLIRVRPAPVSHVIDIDAAYENRWFLAKIATLQDVELKYQTYSLTLGTRPLRDASRTSFLGVSAYTEYSSFRGLGEYRELSAGGLLFGSFDLGYWFPTLRRTALGVDVGWDLHFPYLLDDEKQFRRVGLRQSYHYYFYSRFGVSDALTLEIGYRRRNDVLVAPAAIPLGTFVTVFKYVTEGESDVSLGIEISNGFSIWIKGRINLLN